MSLKDELKKSLVEAAKAREQLRLDTIRSVQSAVRYKEIDKKGELTDAEILAVIGTLCKQHRDSIEQFQKGGRADLAEKETKELNILKKYLPAEMDEATLRNFVSESIKESQATSIKDMGKVMKVVMEKVQGRADNKTVSELVKDVLSKI